jgi:hypothetical protein
MNKKILLYGIIPAAMVGFGAAGISLVSAHGFGLGFGENNLTADQIAERQTEMFQKEADILGVSVEEVKSAWAEGKNMRQLAEEKGLTEQIQEKIKTEREAQMKNRLQTLVDKGVITQAQADQRIKIINENAGNLRDKRSKMGKFENVSGGF